MSYTMLHTACQYNVRNRSDIAFADTPKLNFRNGLMDHYSAWLFWIHCEATAMCHNDMASKIILESPKIIIGGTILIKTRIDPCILIVISYLPKRFCCRIRNISGDQGPYHGFESLASCVVRMRSNGQSDRAGEIVRFFPQQTSWATRMNLILRNDTKRSHTCVFSKMHSTRPEQLEGNAMAIFPAKRLGTELSVTTLCIFCNKKIISHFW